MRNAFEIARAFVVMFFRDRLNVFFTLFFNVFLMILLGLTVEDRFNVRVPIGAYDGSASPTGVALLERIGREPGVRLRRYATDSAVRADVRNGQVVAGLLLAPGTDGAPVHASLLGDPARKVWLRMLSPVLSLALLDADPATAPMLARATVTVQTTRAENLRYFDFLFPGVLAFTVMQVAFSGGLTLLHHRKSEALTRLKLTPLARWQFLGGYAASQACLIGLQVAGYAALAVAVFHYRFTGSLVQSAAVTALGAAEFACLGLLISALAPSVEVGGNLVRALSFPAAFLCGVFVPLDALPGYLGAVSKAYPLTTFVGALRATTNYDASLGAVALPLLEMGIVLVVAAALAVRAFRWEEQGA